MSRLIWVAILGSIFLISDFQDGLAFDGERKGFVLGFGAGVGAIRRAAPDGGYIRTTSTDLKLGFGVTNRLLVYYSGHTSVAFDKGEWSHLFVSPSVATAFYLRSESPSFYFLGEFGTTIDINNSDIGIGPNVSLGVGFEMFRHLTLELVATRVFVNDPLLQGGRRICSIHADPRRTGVLRG